MPVEYTRQKTPAEEKAAAREKVRQAAERGESPRLYKEPDLRWAFGADYEAAVAELERVAEEARTARLERERAREAAEQFRREVDKVLLEWAAAEKAERRKLAEQEARRQLGLGDVKPKAKS
jgi:hypothetical protein